MLVLAGVYCLIVLLMIVFFIFMLMTIVAEDYENEIEKGIKYLDDINLYLEKIRGIISLSDDEIFQKTKLKATVGEIDINLKEGTDCVVKTIRQELREEEEEWEVLLMQGYKFPEKPPKSYIFWRKKILGIPPMTIGQYREIL